MHRKYKLPRIDPTGLQHKTAMNGYDVAPRILLTWKPWGYLMFDAQAIKLSFINPSKVSVHNVFLHKKVSDGIRCQYIQTCRN